MGLTLGYGAWQIDRPSNGSMWNSYSFQPVGQWMGYSFTDLGAEGCCRPLNALLSVGIKLKFYGSLQVVNPWVSSGVWYHRKDPNQASDFGKKTSCNPMTWPCRSCRVTWLPPRVPFMMRRRCSVRRRWNVTTPGRTWSECLWERVALEAPCLYQKVSLCTTEPIISTYLASVPGLHLCLHLIVFCSLTALEPEISMAKCKTAVYPLITYWCYCSFALSRRFVLAGFSNSEVFWNVSMVECLSLSSSLILSLFSPLSSSPSSPSSAASFASISTYHIYTQLIDISFLPPSSRRHRSPSCSTGHLR